MSKIINESSNCSVSIVRENLRDTLEGMVQDGKISSEERVSKIGKNYILYSINYKGNSSINKFDLILESLEQEFDIEKFKKESKSHGYNEKDAERVLEEKYQLGEIMQIRPQVYKKIA